MVREATAETKAMTTATLHGRDDMVELRGGDVTFDSVLAVWSGTPLEAVVVIHIGSV